MSRTNKALVACVCAALLGGLVLFVVHWLVPPEPVESDGAAEVTRLDEQSLEHLEVQKKQRARGEVVWIRGVVLSAYGTAVLDAVARVTPVDGIVGGKTSREVKVADTGFAIDVPAGGRYVVEVASDTWGKVALKPRTYRRNINLEISYQALATVSGNFVGNEEELALFTRGPRSVFLEGPINLPGVAPMRLPVEELDPEGLTFRHSGLGPGTFKIVGHYRTWPLENGFEIRRNASEVEIEVPLGEPPERTLVGLAVLDGSAQPLRNTELSGYMLVHGTSTSLDRPVTTDENGHFEFVSQRLMPGVKVVFFRSRDYPSVEVTYGRPEPDGTYLLVFPDPPERQAFVVNRHGEGIPFAGVDLVGEKGEGDIARYEKKADEDGMFAIMDVEPGEYRVTVTLNSGQYQLKEKVEIRRSNEEVLIETDLGRFLFVTAVQADGSPVRNYSVYAVVHRDTPTTVSLNTPPNSTFSSMVGDIDGRIGLGLRDALRVELYAISQDFGFKRLLLDREWLEVNDRVVVRFDAPPTDVEVRILTQEGAPVDDAEFRIPVLTKAARDEVAQVRSSLFLSEINRKTKTPYLRVRKQEAQGAFKMLIYPGEGSRVEVVSPAGRTVVDADDILRNREIVLRR